MGRLKRALGGLAAALSLAGAPSPASAASTTASPASVAFGGEWRERVDLNRNPRLGLGGPDGFTSWQSRLFLHADARLGEALRVFGELAYADEQGRKPGARSYDESGLDVQQAFLEVSPTPAARLRLGRQELTFGDQRLADVRETSNLHRSFEAARLDLTLQGARLSAFAGSPVANDPEAFDDAHAEDETFAGVYATAPLSGADRALDVFWLSRRRPASTFLEGTAKERRETFGARLHGAANGFDYSVTALGQTGRFGAADIRAWAASADLGWTRQDWPGAPRLSVRADLASGDRRAGDGRLGVFDAPYPNTSYLSTTSPYWPGNAWSIFPLARVQPSASTTAFLGVQTMGLMSTNDGFYYGAQNPIRLATGHGRLAMRQIYARLRWTPRPGWTFSGTAIRQFAGEGVRAAGGGDTSVLSLSADWKF